MFDKSYFYKVSFKSIQIVLQIIKKKTFHIPWISYHGGGGTNFGQTLRNNTNFGYARVKTAKKCAPITCVVHFTSLFIKAPFQVLQKFWDTNFGYDRVKMARKCAPFMYLVHFRSLLKHPFRFCRNFETQISKKLVSVNITTPIWREFHIWNVFFTYFKYKHDRTG